MSLLRNVKGTFNLSLPLSTHPHPSQGAHCAPNPGVRKENTTTTLYERMAFPQDLEESCGRAGLGIVSGGVLVQHIWRVAG